MGIFTSELIPAYDLTFAYKPGGPWTSRHQVTVNGKADGFVRAVLKAVGALALSKRGRATAILDEVLEAVRGRPEIAAEVGVEAERIAGIARDQRLEW